MRRPFEAITRRLWGTRKQVQFGPLRGAHISGGLSQILGIYELHVQQSLAENLVVGDVFFDIGANNGYLTLLGAHLVGRTGQVYAFEPFPVNIRAIERVISDNHLENCMLVPQAVADRSGVLAMFAGGDDCSTTASLLPTGASQKIEVQATTLNQFSSLHPFPSLVKIDVEGAEDMVLEAATEILAHDPAPVWLIEVHYPHIDRRVKAILARYEFTCQEVPALRQRQKRYPFHILATRT